MAETSMLLDDERTADDTATEALLWELCVVTAQGTFHLTPPPTASARASECERALASLPFTASTLSPLPWSRCYISSRCYDTGFAVLILASAAVALYRLVWMGQP